MHARRNPGNVITPNMDALATTGVVLDRHYTYRWCAPTRSALMTGRLPYHVLQNTDHVSRGFTMLPRKLGQVGYKVSGCIADIDTLVSFFWSTPVSVPARAMCEATVRAKCGAVLLLLL